MRPTDYKSIERAIVHLYSTLNKYNPRNRYSYGGCLTFAIGLRDAINKYFGVKDEASLYAFMDNYDGALQHVFVYTTSSKKYFDIRGAYSQLYRDYDDQSEIEEVGKEEPIPHSWKSVKYLNLLESIALRQYFVKAFDEAPKKAAKELDALRCFYEFIPTIDVTDEDAGWYSWKRGKRKQLNESIKNKIADRSLQ